MGCDCEIRQRPESVIAGQLLAQGGTILRQLGIDVEKIAAMGYSREDAHIAWKFAALQAALLNECFDGHAFIVREMFEFTAARPGMSKTTDFSIASQKPRFILYAAGIKEALASRAVWVSLRFSGISDDALALALAAKSVRRFLCYHGLVYPFDFGDQAYVQNEEVGCALATTDGVTLRYRNRLPPDELRRKYDGTAVQMIVLTMFSLDGTPIENLGQLVSVVKMGHPDRQEPLFQANI